MVPPPISDIDDDDEIPEFEGHTLILIIYIYVSQQSPFRRENILLKKI